MKESTKHVLLCIIATINFIIAGLILMEVAFKFKNIIIDTATVPSLANGSEGIIVIALIIIGASISTLIILLTTYVDYKIACVIWRD